MDIVFDNSFVIMFLIIVLAVASNFFVQIPVVLLLLITLPRNVPLTEVHSNNNNNY